MVRKTVEELAADISDPSDFTEPGLVQLDSALRCNICRELYEGPVSISCGHCFCSLCVRNSMNLKAECPICRKPANESHIRPNVALENTVVAWKYSRNVVLQLMKDSEEDRGNKRKCSEEGDGDVQIVAGPSKRSRTDSSDVACPICSKVVKADTINDHLDSDCRTPSDPPPDIQDKLKQKNEWSRLLGGMKVKEKVTEDDDDRLPKVSTHIMKEKQLREMLASYSLNTTGDKSVLIARYQQWMILYNANQDRSSKQRQTLDQLRKELKKWEELGQGKKVVVGDPGEYEKTHKDEFDRLIEQARTKKPLTRTFQLEDIRTPGSSEPSLDISPHDVIEVD